MEGGRGSFGSRDIARAHFASKARGLLSVLVETASLRVGVLSKGEERMDVIVVVVVVAPRRASCHLQKR